MLPDIVAILILWTCFFVMIVHVFRVCKRESALRQYTLTLAFIAMLWGAGTIVNIVRLSGVQDSYDGVIHEREARNIAEHVTSFSLSSSDFMVVGNKAYRLFLGIFYGITGINHWCIYGINCALGFSGLLFITEGCCRYFGAEKYPLWLLLLTFLLPSFVLWIPLNLKEGSIVFSIGLLLRFGALQPQGSARSHSSVGMAIFGALFLFCLRPHVCAAWICGLSVGGLGQKQSPAQSLATIAFILVVAVGAVYSIELARPGFLNSIADDGLQGSLESGYEKRKDIGDSAIYRQESPIPVVTGLAIIILSPPPQFWGAPHWLIFGLESLALSGLCARSWTNIRIPRLQAIQQPAIAGAVVVILMLALHLSYSYNMGLALRQKIQVVPALLILISGPVLMAQKLRNTEPVSNA